MLVLPWTLDPPSFLYFSGTLHRVHPDITPASPFIRGASTFWKREASREISFSLLPRRELTY